jgi:hypothetical protein
MADGAAPASAPASARGSGSSATPCTKKPHSGNTGSNTKYVEIKGEQFCECRKGARHGGGCSVKPTKGVPVPSEEDVRKAEQSGGKLSAADVMSAATGIRENSAPPAASSESKKRAAPAGPSAAAAAAPKKPRLTDVKPGKRYYPSEDLRHEMKRIVRKYVNEEYGYAQLSATAITWFKFKKLEDVVKAIGLAATAAGDSSNREQIETTWCYTFNSAIQARRRTMSKAEKELSESDQKLNYESASVPQLQRALHQMCGTPNAGLVALVHKEELKTLDTRAREQAGPKPKRIRTAAQLWSIGKSLAVGAMHEGWKLLTPEEQQTWLEAAGQEKGRVEQQMADWTRRVEAVRAELLCAEQDTAPLQLTAAANSVAAAPLQLTASASPAESARQIQKSPLPAGRGLTRAETPAQQTAAPAAQQLGMGGQGAGLESCSDGNGSSTKFLPGGDGDELDDEDACGEVAKLTDQSAGSDSEGTATALAAAAALSGGGV